MKKIVYLLSACLCLMACASHSGQNAVDTPAFAVDSAYQFISWQVHMGPRVPDTQAHTKCVIGLFRLLDRYGASPEMQMGRKINYAGQEQQLFNVIGHYGPMDANNRILLCAHYDSRPWCDQESDFEARSQALPGANDGASGVGVLLEVARQLSLLDSLAPAVDIVFFDCEDMGTPDFYEGVQRDHTWCLGSQLWAERAVENDWARHFQYGILLDMVGAPDAQFCLEYYSAQYAQSYQQKIWRKAHDLGHARYFVNQQTYPLTDDHYYVNRIGIPCVDIIHYDGSGATGFPFWWHTREDNMRHISKSTLSAVGETVMAMVMEQM